MAAASHSVTESTMVQGEPEPATTRARRRRPLGLGLGLLAALVVVAIAHPRLRSPGTRATQSSASGSALPDSVRAMTAARGEPAQPRAPEPVAPVSDGVPRALARLPPPSPTPVLAGDNAGGTGAGATHDARTTAARARTSAANARSKARTEPGRARAASQPAPSVEGLPLDALLDNRR